eukprot:TRINITY_DN3928_c0_g1_i1.p1 TRINITY_DN3928_c0_g1~~TRINITY_DN3928_c0_g1_i1.p1  ORF type:complete len:120 (+),score=25.78 TRINITY_DN3928_c0_g1_i1:1590-1949(+)
MAALLVLLFSVKKNQFSCSAFLAQKMEDRFSGRISPEIGNCSNLNCTDLSNNLLTKLRNLSYLTYLDLHGNEFEEKMPPKLGTSLKYFNVSYNRLSWAQADSRKFMQPHQCHLFQFFSE